MFTRYQMKADSFFFFFIPKLIKKSYSDYLEAAIEPSYMQVMSVQRLNWNTSKGNQAPIQNFERPNRKKAKI